MTDAFVISGVRVTHHSGTLDDLETASYADPHARVDELLAIDDVEEATVLQTCNRVEEYVVTASAEAGREALTDFPALSADAVVRMNHTESLRHLLRVAAGLESQVLGEDEVLGQVRTVYNEGVDRGALGNVLEPVFLKAIHVGERARTETAINEGIVSLGSAAIDLARREATLDGGSAVIVGAGDMATTVATALPDSIDRVTVVNRSRQHADDLVAQLDGPAEADDLDSLPHLLSSADLVVSTTGSQEPVIDADLVSTVGETLLIDLAQPRDVARDVRAVEDVDVYDLEDLRTVTAATHQDRRDAAYEVESIVDEEFDLLLEQFKRARADAVVAAMHRGGERMKEAQLTHALAKLDGELTDEQREIIESLADSLVSQLLAVPTKSLRDAAAEDDWETIATAIDLFDPSLEGEPDIESLFDATEGAAAEESQN